MERLTRTDWKEMVSMECCGQKDYCIRRREVENACLNCIVPRLYARVAMFEDMELTYEKAARMKEVIEVAFDRDTSRLERAYEVNKADKEERVVVLPPCKIGDTLYCIENGRIYPCVVVAINFCLSNTLRILSIRVKNYRGETRGILESELGKTAFLSLEEVGMALGGRADGNQ